MKNKLVVVLSVVIIGVLLFSVLFFLRNNEPEINYTEDELKFKDEYEKLNGYELKENYVLKTIDINIDNNVKYVNDEEIMDLLTKGNNVIYLGWSDCNWCRSIVPTLIETIKNNNIENLYYYDFKSLRNNYENNSDEDKVKLYEDIVKIVGDKIESTFDEKSPRNGEKKILAPTVIFIKDGKLIGVHVKSVDSHINSVDELNSSQKNELKSIYEGYINQLNANVCVDEGC